MSAAKFTIHCETNVVSVELSALAEEIEGTCLPLSETEVVGLLIAMTMLQRSRFTKWVCGGDSEALGAYERDRVSLFICCVSDVTRLDIITGPGYLIKVMWHLTDRGRGPSAYRLMIRKQY